MEIFNNYSAYKKYLPQYESWEEIQNSKRAKRIQIVKQNPSMIDSESIQRGKILLHAIDIMDEYSQSNAEDIEVITRFAQSQVAFCAESLGVLGGFALSKLPSYKKFVSAKTLKNPELSLLFSSVPMFFGMLAGFAATFPLSALGAKIEVGASRRGRFEAMNNDLKNSSIFAVLTPKQKKKAEEIAETIHINSKEEKQIKQKQELHFSPIESFKTMMNYYNGTAEYKKNKAEFESKLKINEKYFDKKLSEEQILQAKKDQQIIADMVREIDIASQDYAENVEMAVNTLETLALGTGGLVGIVSDTIMKALKIGANSKLAKVIPWTIGAIIPIYTSICSSQLSKHASRVGRFKIKQEFLNNPEMLIYVDDKDVDKIKDIKSKDSSKKPNVFKFLRQVIADNKTYKNYVKENSVKDFKFQKAVEKLDLTDEQIKNAKALQLNVFKTFNKVDEKSQTYSESVEAIGEIAKRGILVFGSLASTIFIYVNALKAIENFEVVKKNPVLFAFKSLILPVLSVIVPTIAVDVMTTKAQKKASRVADMLALDELSDYRNYVDYSSKENQAEKVNNNRENTNLLTKFNNFDCSNNLTKKFSHGV